MKKLWLFTLLTLLILGTFAITMRSDESNLMLLDEKYRSPQDDAQEVALLEKMKSRREDPHLDEVKEKVKENKIASNLSREYEKLENDNVISVLISLNSDADEKQFEQKVLQYFEKDITFKKYNYLDYEAELNKQQIDLIQTFNEVMLVSSPGIYSELHQ